MELENYCKIHIIHQRFSDAYTPQQNGPLTLNQIPAHKSKKSPYKIFKGASIPIDFFHPIGNPVYFHSNRNKIKLEPRGKLGRLIGLNPELKSYRILANNGRIVNTKHVNFLEFSRDHQNMEHENSEELVVEQWIIKSKDTIDNQISENQDKVEVKTEEEDNMERTVEDIPYKTADEDGSSENGEIEEILIPQPALLAGRTLCERTIQVKTIKCSHLTVEPSSFNKAVTGADLPEWKKAI
ncbi:hypothetical protein VP01_1144g3 [Puccinia sorghi]|uniref:Retroviral polymerase SH3-like domain-containing protein n=1 Tax=Puccinia sorghi TaxID=27349 RepID=A0A0L6VRU0_9BASI|nr:hypothetical protein VP01_1144g3 [Puccinia sorghi]